MSDLMKTLFLVAMKSEKYVSLSTCRLSTRMTTVRDQYRLQAECFEMNDFRQKVPRAEPAAEHCMSGRRLNDKKPRVKVFNVAYIL